jgi:hypothetical protein
LEETIMAPWFWSFALLLHLVGLTLIAAGTIGGLALHRAIGRSLAGAPAQAAAAARVGRHFPIMTQAGAVVMLLSGLGLLATRQWIYVGQPWLTVKLGLYVLLWLNGLLVARPAAQQFGRALPQWVAIQGALPLSAAPQGTTTSSRAEIASALARVRRRLTLFHTSQALGVATILILAVFKFH